MEVLVIGYKNGIGKGIYDILSYSGSYVPYGISKDQFDIDNPIEFDFNYYDIIVINAYSEFTSQLKLLYDITSKIDKSKLVVVIGSTSAYKCNPTDFYWAKYHNEKSAIIRAGRDLNTMGYNVSVLSLGTVDTYRNINKSVDKMSVNTIGSQVMYVLDNYVNGILLEHLVIRPTK